MSDNRHPGPIPNCWLHCPRRSDFIIAEKFLAFKTPLNDAYRSQIPTECVFTPGMIFDYCRTLKLKLGLWIDLTNTTRFYNRTVVEAHGAQYVKLKCRGHEETPSPGQTRAFIETVRNFIQERPFDIIGVHGTHGFNRTGFLISSYLVENLDFSLEAALSMFSQARSPGIYKQNYISELYRRFGRKPEYTPAPQLPDWCMKFDGFDENGRRGVKRKHLVESSDNDDDGNKNSYENTKDQTQEKNGNHKDNIRKKPRRESNVKSATFMEGVPGVVCVQDQSRLRELQKKVQNMCGWVSGGFPGTQPVSMDCENVIKLSTKPYRVSWKASGRRYMMLINKRDEIFFFDRNNACFQVEGISFVKSSNLNEHLEDTLIDGEMVLDKYNGEIIPRYLIYDVIKISNFNIGKKPFFPDRLKCIEKELIEPRIRAIEKGIIHRPSEPFGIRNKEFWDIRKSASLLGENFIMSLLHESDGLIFQPSKEPFTPGVCSHVLKWKPPKMHSIDFCMKIKKEEDAGIVKHKLCLLFVGGHDKPYAQMKYTKALKDLDNRIIECTVNQIGQWEFLRERSDKTFPNSYSTAESVIESIRNPVTKEILLNYTESCGFLDDSEMVQRRDHQQLHQKNPHQHDDNLLHGHYHVHQEQEHLFTPPKKCFDDINNFSLTSNIIKY